MTEQWKPVVGYEGLYEVSNIGRVRGVSGVRTAIRKDGSIYKFNYVGKELKHSLSLDGYHDVGLSCNGTIKNCKVHRLVVEAFYLMNGIQN